jgi:hypothetical protein
LSATRNAARISWMHVISTELLGELLDQLEQPNLRENVSASPSPHFRETLTQADKAILLELIRR